MPDPTSGPPVAVERRRPPRTVLVADDSATVRAVVAAQLAGAGYRVLEAADGREAVDAVHREDVDVVLLDVEMPVLDGWHVLRTLKAEPETEDVAVLFLTGRGGSADVVQALELGAVDFVRKPIQSDELLARVAVAVRTKQQHERLRHRADRFEAQGRTDALTGLPNRRHAEGHLTEALAAAAGEGRSLAVLLVDVDRFKAVNDVHGHAAGDTALVAVAECLRSAVRGADLVARWGGEEFLVVSSAPDVGELAERLRAAVARTGVQPAPGASPVTVSVGGVSRPPDDGDTDLDAVAARLLAAADRNLYRAKAEGRDRAVATAG